MAKSKTAPPALKSHPERLEEAIRALAGAIGQGHAIDRILDPDDGIRGRDPDEIEDGQS